MVTHISSENYLSRVGGVLPNEGQDNFDDNDVTSGKRLV